MVKVLGPRATAAKVLAGVIGNKKSLSRLLPEATPHLEQRDRALTAELCYGVCRYYPRLKALLKPLLRKPLKAKDTDIDCLLLLGVYQISYMRIPDHAALSETVAASRQLGKPWAKAFINGVLRQYQRRSDELVTDLDESAALCHPRWMLEKIRGQWPKHWEQVVAANNHPPPMTLRVNLRRGKREDYLQRLRQSGISAREGKHSPSAIVLESPCDVSLLPGFNEGLCSVQDEAGQLVAPLSHDSSAKRVLDACAAPGGKTGHILELAPPDFQLDAVEIDSRRLGRIEENLQRLQLTAHLIEADASLLEDWWNGEPYDAILLDAPCSASGVIRRHPDIKVLRQPADLAKLHTLQQELLHALWRSLRPGGQLLYTTCSVFEEENDASFGAFLQSEGDAMASPIVADWGHTTRHGRQLLPETDSTDGFYFARCIKQPRKAAQQENHKKP